jgi:hypothetical protein
MVEAEETLHRMQQASFSEAHEVPIDVVVGQEVGQLGARKATADHRAAAHDLELAGIKSVEAAGEQGFDGCGGLVEAELRCFLHEREQLLGEEGVST